MIGKHIQCYGIVLGALLLIPSADSAAQTRTRNERPARCYRVDVSSPESSSSRRRDPSFSAAEILDLELRAYVSRQMTGQHEVEFKVFTPKGNLYQSMELSFDADAAADDGKRANQRYQVVTATLPVAGTSIVSSSIYGTWSVEAYLDGDEKRCSSPRKFVIEP